MAVAVGVDGVIAMGIFNQEHRPPEPTEADTGYSILRASLGTIPVIGSAAQELLRAIVAPPLARRQQEWAEGIGIAVRRLEQEKGVPPEALRDNPAFVDAVLSATQAAIRTSQEEKRTALLNAALNAGLPGAPEVAVQQMFIALVDRFTEWHLRVLRLFHDPASAMNGAGGYPGAIASSLSHVLETVYPQLKGRRDLYDQLWADLSGSGLLNTGSLQTMMTPGGTLVKRTTPLGDRFLEFISSPFSA
jgi:hypothetical protein